MNPVAETMSEQDQKSVMAEEARVPSIHDMTIALNDAAAHARVLATNLAIAIAAIRTDYPNNKLGGLIDRIEAIAMVNIEHALALETAADKALKLRPEASEISEAGYGKSVPKSVLALFECADLIRVPVSVSEAKQLADKGKLVVIRDLNAQSSKMVPQYGAIFEPDVDPVVVRLWWPRIFSTEVPVALLESEAYGVWIETSTAIVNGDQS